MQLIIEATDIHDLKTRIFDLNEQLNSIQPGSRAVSQKQFPPELQQAVLDSAQVETKGTKKGAAKKAESIPVPVYTDSEAPTPPTTKRGKVITKEELQTLVQQLVNKKGLPKTRQFLSTLGVDVLRNLPEDRYVSVHDAMKMELQG